MLPTLTLKYNIYTLTLIREGKPLVYKFSRRYHVIIYHTDETSLEPSEREKILGPAFDGIIYWIDVSFPGERQFIWISKDEFDILEPILAEEEEKYYYESADAYWKNWNNSPPIF